MFGGPELDILFVTTMALNYSGQSAPLRGSLLAVTGLGVRGLPEPRFAG
jgi:sugar lactone lactonase YvrE